MSNRTASHSAERTTSIPVAPHRADSGGKILWRTVFREIGLSVFAGFLSVVAAVIALRISPSDLTKRWNDPSADAILHYMLFKSSTQAFSFANNADLGFPHGLNVFFTNQVDASSAVVMSVMALFIHNGFLLLNLFWLLTFVGAGVTGYFFFRAMRIRPWIALLFGTIFSIAPYHFIKVLFGHAFLGNYWAIPLVGILMLVAAGNGTDPFRRWGDAAGNRRSRLLRRLLPPVVLGLLVASSSAYFFVFGVLVVGGVWAFTVLRILIRRQRASSLLIPTSAIVPMGLFVVLELVLLSGGYGQRSHVYFSGRSIAESEYYAGKLIPLLAPWTGTGVPFVAGIERKYETYSQILLGSGPVGTPILASVGLILLAAALVIFAVAGRTNLSATWFGRVIDDQRTRMLAPAMAWTFLFYIVSGLGMAVALVASPDIRAWSRISIILVLIGLAFTAHLVQEATTRFGIRKILIGLVILVAIFDQVVGVNTILRVVPANDTEVSSFVASTDKALPNGCGVVQLPIKGFPESGPLGTMQDYDEAMPYLYTKSDDLRWSYGSVTATNGWNTFGNVTTPQGFETAVKSTGACAIEIDLRGYSSNLNGWQAMVKAATGTTVPTIVSSGKRYLLFVMPGK
jgi:hypothetical protein